MKNFPLSAESAPEEFREKDKVGGPVRSCPPPPLRPPLPPSFPPGLGASGRGRAGNGEKRQQRGEIKRGGGGAGVGGEQSPPQPFRRLFSFIPKLWAAPKLGGRERRGRGGGERDRLGLPSNFAPGGAL